MGNDRKPLVLLVDDEENILASLCGVLEDDGYEVQVARRGEEALDRLAQAVPDAILLDIWMPGIDGMEVLRRIRTTHPDVQVIMVTGHGTIETAVQATKIGAFDFFEKPLSAPAVLHAVRRAVEHRRLLIENRQLRLEALRPHPLAGESRAMQELRSFIDRAAAGDDPVLLIGEPGVGKKLCARLIHHGSHRKDGPFVVFAAYAREPAEIEPALGAAWRSATGDRLAKAGSLYVDGAEHLPPSLWEWLHGRPRAHGPRLLLGWVPGERQPPAAARLLALIPPLRERSEDVPVLGRLFLWEACREHGRPEKALAPEAERALASYAWPSNVEELKNVTERLALTSAAATVGVCDLPMVMQRGAVEAAADRAEEVSFEEAEKRWESRFLADALRRHDGDIRATARRLSLRPEALQRKLSFYGLSPASPPAGRRRQRTLSRSVVLAGLGLHSGVKTGLILSPLPPDSGILFGSVSHGETVPARIEYVDRTGYATGIRRGKAVAKTIEHLMAALHAFGVTNLLVKVADEVPIMDGSALDFCQLIEDGGVIEQDATVEEIRIDRIFSVGDPADPEGEWITVEPSDAFEVSYDLVYGKPVGHQHYAFRLRAPDSFKEEIAPARTFGFLKDIAALEEMGLASGGRLSNFILIDDEKVVNTELRFSDELVRHKILDIMGDFYLLGRPVMGRVRARKTGHGDNVALLRQIQEAYPEAASIPIP